MTAVSVVRLHVIMVKVAVGSSVMITRSTCCGTESLLRWRGVVLMFSGVRAVSTLWFFGW